MPVVFILAPAMTYERQRLMEKDVYFVMSEKYANLPMLVAMEKVSSRNIQEAYDLFANRADGIIKTAIHPDLRT